VPELPDITVYIEALRARAAGRALEELEARAAARLSESEKR
jgi:hypothetical protein